MEETIKKLSEIIEKESLESLKARNCDCEANRLNCKVKVKLGKKYIKVDKNGSGFLMIEIDTGKIYGIKAYGVINRNHYYGTLETIDNYYWGSYKPQKKD